MSDFLIELEKKKVGQILKSGSSYDEWDVYCPYCAKEQQDVWDWDIKPNDEFEEIQCQSCDRHFAVKSRVVFSTKRLSL